MTERVKVEVAAKMLGVRVEVAKFALLMEAKLAKHDEERGSSWKRDDPHSLLNRISDIGPDVRGELAELADAVEKWVVKQNSSRAKKVAMEAADVANFAMMVADVVGGLDA